MSKRTKCKRLAVFGIIALLFGSLATCIVSPWSEHHIDVRSFSSEAESIAFLTDYSPHQTYFEMPLPGRDWVTSEGAITCGSNFLVSLRDSDGVEVARSGPFNIQDGILGWSHRAKLTVRDDNSIDYKGADKNACVMG